MKKLLLILSLIVLVGCETTSAPYKNWGDKSFVYGRHGAYLSVPIEHIEETGTLAEGEEYWDPNKVFNDVDKNYVVSAKEEQAARKAMACARKKFLKENNGNEEALIVHYEYMKALIHCGYLDY